MDDEEYKEMRKELTRFQVEYEQRHAELSGRVSVVEEIISNLATTTDLQKMKTELIEAIGKAVGNAVATKTDVAWLKKAFWVGLGAMVTFGGSLIAHLAGKF